MEIEIRFKFKFFARGFDGGKKDRYTIITVVFR